MDSTWGKAFQERMAGFAQRHNKQRGVPVSIKVRVISGCFHQQHSPRAYEIIDKALARDNTEFEYVPHESGPELLVYVALGTAGITLAKSVIDLITTIIKARADGIKKGDQPSYPLEVIVRRIDEVRQVKEEVVLRTDHHEPVDVNVIERCLGEALQRLTDAHRKDDS